MLRWRYPSTESNTKGGEKYQRHGDEDEEEERKHKKEK